MKALLGFGLLLIGLVTAVQAADYAREQRWADEIAPGIVVGDATWLQLPGGRRFLAIHTEAKNAKGAVIVVHGSGIHPDWGLNGVLRTRLADEGYTTLSIQMPVLAADAKHEPYVETFPEAAERIAAALGFLQGKGHRKIALVSHSMGARMSNHYLAKNPRAPLFAWAALGISSGVFEPLGALQFPVLDLYGEKDFPQVIANADKRAEVIRRVKGSAQVMVAGTDHFFNGKEEEMVKNVRAFLDQALRRAP
ncbi:MAG: DUF3530 family protein [Betaproteobacteria bacterium]|nr:DUF3530 family protein [Betaproteobacteria bacterium]